MLTNSLYVNTKDEKGTTHAYRLPVTDTVPEGHEITGVRKAGVFTLAQVLTAAQRTALTNAVRKNR